MIKTGVLSYLCEEINKIITRKHHFWTHLDQLRKNILSYLLSLQLDGVIF